MSAPTPTAFEDQVAAALRQRAEVVRPDDDARVAIDRRIGQRTRARRLRRVGVAALVVIALVAGALALVQGGHDDANVVTVPGVPAVDIPRLGMPPQGDVGRSGVASYSPGRGASVRFYPKVVSPSDGIDVNVANPALGAQFVLYVTEVTPPEYVQRHGAEATVVECHVDDHPAECVSSAAPAPSSRGEVVWQPADGVLAVLSVQGAAASEAAGAAGARAAAVASELVELDDAAWWTRSGSQLAPIGLGLSSSDGHSELALYGPSEQGGSSVQVFDAPGWAPGTFELISSASATPATSLPTQFAGVKLEDVTVRGVPGVVTTAPEHALQLSPFHYTRSLIWVEGGMEYRLDLTDAATTDDAVTFAGRLAPMSDEQWHDLLFPETIRPDLVPMRDVTLSLFPPITGG